MSHSCDGVSVVIPTFNRVAKVVGAIDSVLDQTFPQEHLEIIVVDDGSTDDTASLLRSRYGDRIRYVRQDNQGPSAARNKGIDAATYSLLAFLDSDDRWMPDKIEAQVACFSDKDVVLSYCNWNYPRNGFLVDRFSEIGIDPNQSVVVMKEPLEALLRTNGSGIWTSTCVVRKDKARRCGRFDERMRICEDTRLWFRLSMEGSFAALGKAMVVKGEGGIDNLTLDARYQSQAAALRTEVYWETYARAGNARPDVLERLRALIVTSLYAQSVGYALDRENCKARRKAIEALAFQPGGFDICKLVL